MANMKRRTCDRGAAVPAPRASWPGLSTPSSADAGRSLPYRSRLGARAPWHHWLFRQPWLSVKRCNDNEESRRLLNLRPHLSRAAPQGTQLLLRQVPRAASPSQGLQEAEPHETTFRERRTAWQGLVLPAHVGEGQPHGAYVRPMLPQTRSRDARIWENVAVSPCFMSPSSKAGARALSCAPRDGRCAPPWPMPAGFRQPRPASSPW